MNHLYLKRFICKLSFDHTDSITNGVKFRRLGDLLDCPNGQDH